MLKRSVIYFNAVIVVSISMVLLGNAFCAYASENNTITKGVFVDEVDISGMTAKEAEQAINEFVNELKSKKIIIQVGEETVATTLDDMGYTNRHSDAIEQALELGTSGNLIKRYKDLKDIAHGGVEYPLEFTLDENKVKEHVSTELVKFNEDPVDASVSRSKGKMIYTDHILGRQVDVEATVLSIVDKIENSWDRNDIVVDAYMEDVTPIYTRDVVEQCNTLLGTFSTEYTDSAEGRASNLANGARLINNSLLYPGEVFSGYEHLAPFTGKNGYFVAGAYSKGKVIDSVGGGACQVTTTLYNAVLEAELEIVERQSHSMTISYAKLSRDAAIAGTYKDLKFMNNTDVPILIEAFTKGRKITFKIWGHETRDTDNRQIEFETRVLAETPAPADVINEDPTKPITYRKVTQSAHTGYKTELYKVVYENGVEVSRTLVNKSYYAPAPRYVTVGTKVVEKAPEDSQNLETDNEDKTDDQEQKPNTEEDNQEQETQEAEDTEEALQENLTNPDDQLQWDTSWDSDWDEEGLEDE